ncbi:MAG: thioredoxin [Gammaproteobacteria bacterium RBG_16_37_9]|nr:MAG: thioredoxin [Gammaproteobacteria bacterium RBG_16_37_9]
MSENITIITDDSFDAEVIQSTIPVLVDFWAEWCGPCKMIAPTVEIVAKEFAGKIKVTKLNVDENNKIATSYNIRGIPTLMFFKNGKIVASKTGALTKTQLVDFINANLQ